MPFNRVVVILLDGVGIGETPDAADFNDAGSDTLGHVAEHRPLRIPALQRLGLGNIRPLRHIAPSDAPEACYGKAAIASKGKDSVAGHWELAGIPVKKAFPTYPNGFPKDVVDEFERAIHRKTLGNVAASGTEIIKLLGAEHMRTGSPIIYSSADSVFQVAAHEEVIPIDELYKICEVARKLLMGEHEVARVIARPFIGSPGNFTRTIRRHDYAIEPPAKMLLDVLAESGRACMTVGKVSSIYCGRGVTRSLESGTNEKGIAATSELLREAFEGLLFANLGDFDTLYGHRNDIEGFAGALEAFDSALPDMTALLRTGDLCLITADHGNDPYTPSTDHSREYVPILAFGPNVKRGTNLGTRATLADVGQTIADNFGLSIHYGSSFLKDISTA